MIWEVCPTCVTGLKMLKVFRWKVFSRKLSVDFFHFFLIFEMRKKPRLAAFGRELSAWGRAQDLGKTETFVSHGPQPKSFHQVLGLGFFMFLCSWFGSLASLFAGLRTVFQCFSFSANERDVKSRGSL